MNTRQRMVSSESKGFNLRLYAQFDRNRGGLLFTLQSFILVGQLGLMKFGQCLGSWWSPILLAPLYFVYLLIRDDLWIRLYRNSGQLGDNEMRAEARLGIWIALAVSLLVPIVNLTRLAVHPPVSLIHMLGWTAVFWLGLAKFGRLPVDGAVFVFTWQLAGSAMAKGVASSLWFPLLGALALQAIYGLWEHWIFTRAFGSHSGKP